MKEELGPHTTEAINRIAHQDYKSMIYHPMKITMIYHPMKIKECSKPKTYFFHLRTDSIHIKGKGDIPITLSESDWHLNNKGGTTVAMQLHPEGARYTYAECSEKDNFSKKIGRAIAEGRLKKGKYMVLVGCNDVKKFSEWIFQQREF